MTGPRIVPAEDEAHEKDVARWLGGKRQPGSGCINADNLKADVKTDVDLIECKATNQLGFRITIAILEKIMRQAAATARNWVVAIRIRRYDCVLISMKRYKELLDYERESRG